MHAALEMVPNAHFCKQLISTSLRHPSMPFLPIMLIRRTHSTVCSRRTNNIPILLYATEFGKYRSFHEHKLCHPQQFTTSRLFRAFRRDLITRSMCASVWKTCNMMSEPHPKAYWVTPIEVSEGCAAVGGAPSVPRNLKDTLLDLIMPSNSGDIRTRGDTTLRDTLDTERTCLTGSRSNVT